jgi:hypothetical protein
MADDFFAAFDAQVGAAASAQSDGAAAGDAATDTTAAGSADAAVATGPTPPRGRRAPAIGGGLPRWIWIGAAALAAAVAAYFSR